jgi:O-antigen ligase
MALIPLVVCIVGIAGLFYLDRDKTTANSRALWLPVIWLWIIGSRPVSVWLGVSPSSQDLSQQLDGSPTDRLVFQVLLAAGIIVLLRRSSRTKTLLRANGPILIFFIYCLVSVLWSPYPDVAFKRWIKAIAELAMVLIVMTDPDPIAALKRFLSRTGFILLPASVFLIRYSDMGRGYDPDGNPMNTGVTTNKNILGVLVLLISLGAMWRFLLALRAKGEPCRARHMVAQGTLLAFGVALLAMAHSATAVACFMLGAFLMLATGLPAVRRRSAAVHAVVLILMLGAGVIILFGAAGNVMHALGRQTNLTGRTDIWKAVLPAVPNVFVGAGFESFWISPTCLAKVWRALSGWFNPRGLNEAHNGYIEVYLNLGLVGVGLIALILINGYARACAAFRRDSGIGGLMLAYVATAAIYSLTEGGFRMLNPIWFFLLLAEIGAVRVVQRGRQVVTLPDLRDRDLVAREAVWGTD